MAKKIITFLLLLTIVLTPAVVWADTEDVELAEYQIHNDNMHISLPYDGWYINTPRDISKEFLEVSENSKRKLVKYLNDNDIDYNVVSEDLKTEINVILVNSSQSKTMFDFNLIEDEVLLDRAKGLVELGTQEEKDIKTTYNTYRLEEFNKCTFMVFEGTVESEADNVKFYQYTTMINGYGISVTLRSSEGADYESDKMLLEKIVHTLDIKEVKEVDLKTNMYKQMALPIAVVVVFVGFVIFIFVRQIRKNKREEAANKKKE